MRHRLELTCWPPADAFSLRPFVGGFTLEAAELLWATPLPPLPSPSRRPGSGWHRFTGGQVCWAPRIGSVRRTAYATLETVREYAFGAWLVVVEELHYVSAMPAAS